MSDEGYRTPEGFWLHRPLLLPDVRDFAEIATYVREWDFETMSHRNGVIPRPDLVPAEVPVGWSRFDGPVSDAPRHPKCNVISPFCSVSNRRNGMAITVTDLVVDAVKNRLVTSDDRLGLKIVVHESNNRGLVILEHGYIIGSHWLAYIDPATIPPVPE